MADPVAVEVPARAALAGNPSDLYGGAVLAVPVPSLRVRMELRQAAELRIDGADGARTLIEAAAYRAGIKAGAIRWTTNIPMSVGLAGSSAIVIATLRAGGATGDLDVALLAQSVEADDLGIVAGVQDRIVQSFGVPVLVDVAGPTPIVSPLEPAAPVRVLIAWLPSASADSGDYHRALRSSAPDGMAELGEIARRAATAFANADVGALVEAMGASADLRARVAPLPPAHERLAGAVTDAGLVPNSAGSGGAVAAVVTDDAALARAQAAVDDLGGDTLVETYG